MGLFVLLLFALTFQFHVRRPNIPNISFPLCTIFLIEPHMEVDSISIKCIRIIVFELFLKETVKRVGLLDFRSTW